MKKVQKLEAGEYAPYAIMYSDLVPGDGLVLQHLRDNLQMFSDPNALTIKYVRGC